MNICAQGLESMELPEEEKSYIIMTYSLMLELHFKVRDTFQPKINLDDYYVNGNKYNGSRHFRIEWINNTNSGYAEVKGDRAYTIKEYSSQAYDNYRILVPEKYKYQSRKDPIIHECAHFLQHATQEEEKNYVNYNGNNYQEYISQRTELEAHLVQIYYITKYDAKWLDSKMDCEQKKLLNIMMQEYINSNDSNIAREIIMMCKKYGLI